MLKTRFVLISILILIICVGFDSGQPKNSVEEKMKAFSFLQSSFEAQVSLVGKERTKEKINDILGEFFTKEYISLFWNAQIRKGEKGYTAVASDVFDYYIPFFSYDFETKVLFSDNRDKLLVYEWIDAERFGPVIWEGHYEGIQMEKKDDKWKIGHYIYTEEKPTFLYNKSESEQETNT